MHDQVSDPGGDLISCQNAIRSAAFRQIQTVGFLPKFWDYPLSTTIHVSGLNTDPAFLIHLASDSHYWVYPQASLLPCWLGFRQVGLELLSSHPLGNINQFHPVLWESQGSELISAREFIRWAFCMFHMMVSELKSCSFGHMIP